MRSIWVRLSRELIHKEAGLAVSQSGYHVSDILWLIRTMTSSVPKPLHPTFFC